MVSTAMPLRGLQALAMLSSLLVMGCSAEAPPLTQQTVYPVKLMTLEQAQSGTLNQYPGRVSASDHSELSFRVGGELTELAVKAGDTVEKGEVVARLDDRDARTRLENARSNFNLAQATFERMRISLERQAISQARFDEAEAEYLSARAQLASAEDQLSYTVLKAPFDGAVEEIVVNTFETIQPQVELMKIIQTDVLELEMVVSSEWISWLSIGHPITVYIDEIQKEFSASVSGIGANVDPVSQTIQLKGTITETDPALLPGMSGRVLF